MLPPQDPDGNQTLEGDLVFTVAQIVDILK